MRTVMIYFGMACSLIGGGFGFSNNNAYAVLFLSIAILNLLFVRRVWP